MKKRELRLSRAEQSALATKQHLAVCQFLNRPRIHTSVKGALDISNEQLIFQRMCKSKQPVRGKDLEGVMEVASTRSSAAERLGDFLHKFSDQFEVLNDEHVVITVPRKRGRTQIGYYFACLDTISGQHLDPRRTKRLLEKTWERCKRQKGPKNGTLVPCDMESNEMARVRDMLTVFTEPSRRAGLLDVDTQVHFSDLIAYHCSVFAGRTSELARIDECIVTKKGGYIFVEGPSGFGKTALLANLTQSLHRAAYHFISQSLSGSSDIFDPNKEDCLLAGLCRQLQEKAQKSSPVNVNDLRGMYLSLLSEANDTGKTTVVIIDAVDEVDPNRNFLRGLFPHQLPRNTFVIFSARTMGDQTYLPYLGLTSADIAATVTLDRFDLKGVRALLKKVGGKATLLADSQDFVHMLHDTTEGDPFYLRFLVEDIRDGIVGTANIADTPRGLNDYLDMQFELLSKSAESQQQRDILGYILHARGPLSRSLLISLVPGLDLMNFDVLTRGVRRFLLERNGEFTFCHERFRRYFESKVSSQ